MNLFLRLLPCVVLFVCGCNPQSTAEGKPRDGSAGVAATDGASEARRDQPAQSQGSPPAATVGTSAAQSADGKSATNATLRESLIPEPVFNDKKLYQAVQLDIEKHPTLKKLGLDVRVVKIDGGYVTLTALNGRTDLMPRMEQRAYNNPFQDPFPGGRDDIMALVSLMEAVNKNPACKGVFWKELPVTASVRFMERAENAFDELWEPMVGRGQEKGPAGLPARHKAQSKPVVVASVLREVHGLEAAWLPAYEQALAVYPDKRRAWEETKNAIREERYRDAAQSLLPLLDVPAGWLDTERNWITLPDKIRLALTMNIERLERIVALIRERKATLVLRDQYDSAASSLIVLETIDNDGSFRGWLIAGAGPPLSVASAAGRTFVPIDGTWDFVTGGTLDYRRNLDAPAGALYREEEKRAELARRGDKGEGHVPLVNKRGTRRYHMERLNVEVLTEGTDPAVLARIGQPAPKVKVRVGGAEIETGSVVFVVGGRTRGGINWAKVFSDIENNEVLRARPWYEMRDAALAAIEALPDGTLFQVVRGDPWTRGAMPPGGLVRASAETRQAARTYLADMKKDWQGDIGCSRAADLLKHAVWQEPDAIVVLTNERTIDTKGRDFTEALEALAAPGRSTAIHVVCWPFSVENLPDVAGHIRGFVEPAVWRDLAAKTGGSVRWASVDEYFFGEGPIVELHGSKYVSRGTLIYADKSRYLVAQKKADGTMQLAGEGAWALVKSQRVISPVTRESVPEAQRKYLPNGSFVERETDGNARSAVKAPAINQEAPPPTAQVATSFFGVEVSGTSFVYVIDRSGSMSQRDRLGAAKRELIGSLSKLPPETQFQIIFYNLRPDAILQPKILKLHYSTDQNKVLAAREMDKMIPDGGTEHLPALKMALSMKPDVMFFLTDADDLRARDVKEATDMNKDQARIHTIEFGIGAEVNRENQLRELAGKNGGSYRYIDATRLTTTKTKQ